MRFVPYDELDGVPNVIVDGAPTSDTVLTLSHWPRMRAPAELRDDLSAQMVFRYLDHPELHVDVDAVSNSHCDEDGLVSVYTLVDADGARARREQLIDVARAGDFATFETRDAARVAFSISTLVDPSESTLDAAVFADDYAERTSRIYQALLSRVPELVDHVDRFETFWRDEDDHLARSEAAVRDGRVTIDEMPGLDLAVVTVPEEWTDQPVHRFTQDRVQAVHPMAIHNATERFRVAIIHGHRYQVQFRYETWVQYVSRRAMQRVDLQPFARELAERDGALWSFDGVNAITPSLRRHDGGPSTLAPDAFIEQLLAFLEHAPPAWDPFDTAAGAIP